MLFLKVCYHVLYSYSLLNFVHLFFVLLLFKQPTLYGVSNYRAANFLFWSDLFVIKCLATLLKVLLLTDLCVLYH